MSVIIVNMSANSSSLFLVAIMPAKSGAAPAIAVMRSWGGPPSLRAWINDYTIRKRADMPDSR